jgi:O-succinylbenzoate synthase
VHIDRIDLRLLRLPLVRPFETSFGRSVEREFVLVEARAGGLAGWGECVADAHPYYSAETTRTAWYVLEEYLLPAVLGRDLAHPRDVGLATAAVRGHRMAKAALEMACWDLWARQQGVPLWRVLGGEQQAIASGVSVGIQPSLDALLDRIAEELASGYQRVKIKIKPGWDVAIVERVRERFPALPLMVDANAAYTPEDVRHLQALDEFGLMMIEQPLEDEDLGQHAALQRGLRTPVCLDESIVSVARAEEAFALGACRIVNIKPGRVGGFAEAVALHDACARRGVPVWHGGMLETGIGRAANLHLASLPNFTLPSDIAASRRYFVPDLIEPPIEVSARGTIPVPTGPGLGVTIDADRVRRGTIRHSSQTA